MHTNRDLNTRLEEIVLGTPWLANVLCAVRDVGPPDAYVGAGAVRNVVWDFLDGSGRGVQPEDVDVVYFAPNAAPAEWEHRLRKVIPGLRWDVVNQAEVHRWQARQSDRRVLPYDCLEAAIASWPETATAVAIRLCQTATLSVVAPYGLDDLFNLQLRPSPGLIDERAYRSRFRAKCWLSRWPSLTVHDVPSLTSQTASLHSPG